MQLKSEHLIYEKDFTTSDFYTKLLVEQIAELETDLELLKIIEPEDYQSKQYNEYSEELDNLIGDYQKQIAELEDLKGKIR